MHLYLLHLQLMTIQSTVPNRTLEFFFTRLVFRISLQVGLGRIPEGLTGKNFSGCMREIFFYRADPFLISNQQYQSTEGT